VVAARAVVTLQTIVAREVNPFDPAIVTVGTFHAGTKRNIIPDEAKLELNVRSFKPDVQKHLLEAIERIARSEAAAAHAPRDPAVVIVPGEGADVGSAPVARPDERLNETATDSGAGEADASGGPHHARPQHRRRLPSGSIPADAQGWGARSGRSDGGRVRTRPGSEPPVAARTLEDRALRRASHPPRPHPEGGRQRDPSDWRTAAKAQAEVYASYGLPMPVAEGAE
jgi:hypothetical protein